jgi:hypothetical protein
MSDIIEVDGVKVEVLGPETDAGALMFHVEHKRNRPDLWIYRSDAGDWRSALVGRGLTPTVLAPIADRIEQALIRRAERAREEEAA